MKKLFSNGTLYFITMVLSGIIFLISFANKFDKIKVPEGTYFIKYASDNSVYLYDIKTEKFLYMVKKENFKLNGINPNTSIYKETQIIIIK